MLNGILLTQTLSTQDAGGEESQDFFIDLANDILRKIPESYNIEEVNAKYPIMYSNSMNTVLKQVRIRCYKKKQYSVDLEKI